MEIRDRVAVVTGASSGIGKAVAVELARRGAVVVCMARRAAELETTAAECRTYAPESYAIRADVAEPGDCEKVVKSADERFGRVDVLVNNAGISMHKHVLDTSPVDIEQVMRVNFFGAVTMTSLVLPSMVARGMGSIVNITSVAAQIPNPREAAYGAAKAALHAWTHGLAVDLHGTGVHAGVMSPGPIDTEIWDRDETPSSYNGRKYPAQIIADGVARMIERQQVHVTVPRRYGSVGALYGLPLAGRALRRGLVAFERAGEKRAATRGG
jgi:short-subunit dehydrogenase